MEIIVTLKCKSLTITIDGVYLDVLTPALSGATVTITPAELVADREMSWNSACSSLTSQSLCSFLPRKYPLLKHKLLTFYYQNFEKLRITAKWRKENWGNFFNSNYKIIKITSKKVLVYSSSLNSHIMNMNKEN